MPADGPHVTRQHNPASAFLFVSVSPSHQNGGQKKALFQAAESAMDAKWGHEQNLSRHHQFTRQWYSTTRADMYHQGFSPSAYYATKTKTNLVWRLRGVQQKIRLHAHVASAVHLEHAGRRIVADSTEHQNALKMQGSKALHNGPKTLGWSNQA